MTEGGSDTCALTDEEIEPPRYVSEKLEACKATLLERYAEDLHMRSIRKRDRFHFRCLIGRSYGEKITKS